METQDVWPEAPALNPACLPRGVAMTLDPLPLTSCEWAQVGARPSHCLAGPGPGNVNPHSLKDSILTSTTGLPAPNPETTGLWLSLTTLGTPKTISLFTAKGGISILLETLREAYSQILTKLFQLWSR